MKGAYKRILELDQKELAFEGFALGTPLGAPGYTDNASRWLAVDYSEFKRKLLVHSFS